MHELWLSFILLPGLNTLQNTTVHLSTSHCTFIACNVLQTLSSDGNELTQVYISHEVSTLLESFSFLPAILHPGY